ncbi:MAG: hypothetical protein EXR77_12425 [Myxococcales bacterium]|nr:hypothetical protein [Myxococcales bacterium]
MSALTVIAVTACAFSPAASTNSATGTELTIETAPTSTELTIETAPTSDAAADSPPDVPAVEPADGTAARGDSALPTDAAAADANCAAAGADSASAETGAVQVVTGAPAWAVAAKTATLPLPPAVSALARVGNSLWAGNSAGVSVLHSIAPTQLAVTAADGLPAATGAITAMMAMPPFVLIAAANGLFAGKPAMLMALPAAVAAKDLKIAAVSSAPAADDLWLATASGAYRLDKTKLQKLKLPAPWDGAVSAIAVHDGRVWLGVAGSIVHVAVTGGEVQVMASELGHIAGAVAIGDLIGFATNAGLVVIRGGKIGFRFTLAGSGEAPVPGRAVTATQVGDGKSRMWFATDKGALAVQASAQVGADGNTAPALQAVALQEEASTTANPSQVAAITTDAWGHVWLARSGTAHGLLVGQPPSFAKAVAPVLTSKCAYCHASGSVGPKHDFGNMATVQALQEAMVLRMSLGQSANKAPGQMPPKSAIALLSSEYATVMDWFASGMNP